VGVPEFFKQSAWHKNRTEKALDVGLGALDFGL
jgi:hypothetical protein